MRLRGREEMRNFAPRALRSYKSSYKARVHSAQVSFPESNRQDPFIDFYGHRALPQKRMDRAEFVNRLVAEFPGLARPFWTPIVSKDRPEICKWPANLASKFGGQNPWRRGNPKDKKVRKPKVTSNDDQKSYSFGLFAKVAMCIRTFFANCIGQICLRNMLEKLRSSKEAYFK